MFIAAAFVASTSITSCNQETEVPEDDTPANVLCDGKGSTSFFPLAMGNVWVYSGTATTTKTVAEVATVDGEQQYTVEVQGLNDWEEVYTVGSNGDVYFQSGGTFGQDTNYLHVPASPTLNQEWLYTISFDGHITRRITSTTAEVTTSYCTYQNCIEIESYDGTGDYLYAHYYKVGVGHVLTDNTIFTDSKLRSITLN